VERGGKPTAWRRVKTDGSYLSTSDARVHVGLGATEAVDAVVVRWPDGEPERFSVREVDRSVVLKRGSGVKQ
jgi:enediyne biosynthesis protein E4